MHVMIDLETLGIEPGSVILSLGAVTFDRHGLGRGYYSVFSRVGMRQLGLVENPKTVDWWMSQEDRSILDKANDFDVPVGQDLGKFADWLDDIGPQGVWGNGSDFDNVLLASAYRAACMDVPWDFRVNRCYRTIKSLYPYIPIQRTHGGHHDAFADAKNQAQHLIDMIGQSL